MTKIDPNAALVPLPSDAPRAPAEFAAFLAAAAARHAPPEARPGDVVRLSNLPATRDAILAQVLQTQASDPRRLATTLALRAPSAPAEAPSPSPSPLGAVLAAVTGFNARLDASASPAPFPRPRAEQELNGLILALALGRHAPLDSSYAQRFPATFGIADATSATPAPRPLPDQAPSGLPRRTVPQVLRPIAVPLSAPFGGLAERLAGAVHDHLVTPFRTHVATPLRSAVGQAVATHAGTVQPLRALAGELARTPDLLLRQPGPRRVIDPLSAATGVAGAAWNASASLGEPVIRPLQYVLRTGALPITGLAVAGLGLGRLTHTLQVGSFDASHPAPGVEEFVFRSANPPRVAHVNYAFAGRVDGPSAMISEAAVAHVFVLPAALPGQPGSQPGAALGNRGGTLRFSNQSGYGDASVQAQVAFGPNARLSTLAYGSLFSLDYDVRRAGLKRPGDAALHARPVFDWGIQGGLFSAAIQNDIALGPVKFSGSNRVFVGSYDLELSERGPAAGLAPFGVVATYGAGGNTTYRPPER